MAATPTIQIPPQMGTARPASDVGCCQVPPVTLMEKISIGESLRVSGSAGVSGASGAGGSEISRAIAGASWAAWRLAIPAASRKLLITVSLGGEAALKLLPDGSV